MILLNCAQQNMTLVGKNDADWQELTLVFSKILIEERNDSDRGRVGPEMILIGKGMILNGKKMILIGKEMILIGKK